jgi:tRNA (cytidine/uridine-2'-O-)-methyltransferase
MDRHRPLDHPFHWPDAPLHVVLVEPEIPPNTGNVARLCAATGTELHLIEPLGFRLTDRAVRRAGLDYWEHVSLHRHPNLEALIDDLPEERLHLFTTAARSSYLEADYHPGDLLLFGRETAGLPEEVLHRYPSRLRGLPMLPARVRSLNLSNTVAAALYEALRQIHQQSLASRSSTDDG